MAGSKIGRLDIEAEDLLENCEGCNGAGTAEGKACERCGGYGYSLTTSGNVLREFMLKVFPNLNSTGDTQ